MYSLKYTIFNKEKEQRGDEMSATIVASDFESVQLTAILLSNNYNVTSIRVHHIPTMIEVEQKYLLSKGENYNDRSNRNIKSEESSN